MPSHNADPDIYCPMGLLPDKQNGTLRTHRECQGRFPRHRIQRKAVVNHPGMHHGTCHARAVMHVGIANPWRRGKRSRHSRRMRNPQFYVSRKRAMASLGDSELVLKVPWYPTGQFCNKHDNKQTFRIDKKFKTMFTFVVWTVSVISSSSSFLYKYL